MKLSNDTVAGARKIISYWRRVFEEGGAPVEPRRDLVSDWVTVRDLMAAERDEFTAPRGAAATHASISEDPERGERVYQILKRSWEYWASWHADDDQARPEFAGEEEGPETPSA